MALYAVEAVDSQGSKVKHEVSAEDREEAMAQVKDMGLYPTQAKAKRAPAAVAAPPEKRRTLTFGRASMSLMTQFTQQLATLQDTGLPIVRSLKILEGQQKPGVLKNCLIDVAQDVESGSTLSEAMAKHPAAFDRLYVGMIKAGEAGGVLDTILERLAMFMEKSLRLQKKVLGAMIYPLVVTAVAVAILAGIMTFVIPAFETMFNETGITLPAPTALLIAVSGFVADYWFLLPLGPVGFVLLLRLIASHPRGRYGLDRLKLALPVFGTILQRSTVSRFCRTLGTLVSSGVPILDALSITREATTNLVIARAIDEVHAAIREGESIAGPLQASGAFDEMFVNMVEVGEETGALDAMLTKIANTYDDDVDTAVESLSSILEPILIVGMGGAVGFIVIALFMPLIRLIDTLG